MNQNGNATALADTEASDKHSGDATGLKENHQGAAKDNAAIKPEKSGTGQVGKKDIRRHPKYGFLYEVRRYNQLHHVSRAHVPGSASPINIPV